MISYLEKVSDFVLFTDGRTILEVFLWRLTDLFLFWKVLAYLNNKLHHVTAFSNIYGNYLYLSFKFLEIW